ncbi:hypothetical protein [uncultured Nisaea sp.]|uniref:hypothetical protein n=1 Tax=uncultured Nisaea sp. TaxID=538215 RepID=UPI0030ECB8F9
MPVEVRDHGELVEFVGSGDLSAGDIISASTEHHSKTPKKCALWNFLGARISYFRADNFHKVATKGAELARLRGPGARNAIVISNQAERQLLQAYSNMASAVSPVQHEIFYSRDEAIAWLKSDDGTA